MRIALLGVHPPAVAVGRIILLLTNSIDFDPAAPQTSLSRLPAASGVFALRAADPLAEPYLGKTPDLRRRLSRLLRDEAIASKEQDPAPAPTRRLQLARLVRHIEYSVTGSEFESSYVLYEASLGAFGDRGRLRLRLRPPVFLRMSLQNPYPRVYVTTRISRSAADALFGPFASRTAAEHYAEEMLNLFALRRCRQDLNPDPEFAGCVYSEMKMCLAPCFRGCSDERYREETGEVLDFLSSQGTSLLAKLREERDSASEQMQYERAAALHQRMQKAQAVVQLGGDTVRPLSRLSGIVIQPAAAPGQVTLFSLRGGLLSGPVLYSTEGMRHPNEDSGSTSLFPHPVACLPVPLASSARPRAGDLLESRLRDALLQLHETERASGSSKVLVDHLALFVRWFSRPAGRRTGEVLFFENEDRATQKSLLRAISRVARGPL